MRRAAPVGKGGGGGFLVGCDGVGLRVNDGGIETPFAGVELLPSGGGVSRRVPANKSKSSKSRMTALGAEQVNADGPGASGGDVDSGASFSCVAVLLTSRIGTAMDRAMLFSVGRVGMVLFGSFELDEGGCSALDPAIRSSCLLQRSSR